MFDDYQKALEFIAAWDGKPFLPDEMRTTLEFARGLVSREQELRRIKENCR